MTLSKHLSYALFSLVFLLPNVSSASVDPLGQAADYNIDKDPKRTSSMLKSGTIKISVPQEANEPLQVAAYKVKIDYKFKIAIMGDYQGSKDTQIEKEYFTEEFLQNLREKGHYEGQYFKADHLGYADAKNLDGKLYPHCDKILLYDLKEPGSLTLFGDLLASMLHPLDVDRSDMEDMKVLAHIYVGVPVLGAVKVDVSGKYQGMDVKAGADYAAR